MISNLGYALIGILIVAAAAVFQPTRCWCPHGWYVNGVRPSGSFECRRSPMVDASSAAEVNDGTPDWILPGTVYCAHPIVLDERTVGCQH